MAAQRPAALLIASIVVVAGLSAPLAFAQDAGTPAAPATVPPPVPAPVKLNPKTLKAPKATPELVAKGKAVFLMNCVPCHGEAGDGKGPVGLALQPPPRNFTKDPFKQGTKPEEIFVSITEGVPATPMVGWSQLTDDDRWALAQYVLTFVPKANKGAKASAK